MDFSYLIWFVVVNAVISFIPAVMGKRRGYSFLLMWTISFFFSFAVGLIVVLSNPRRVKREKNTSLHISGTCPKCGSVAESEEEWCYDCGANKPPPLSVEVVKKQEHIPRSVFVRSWLGIIIVAAVLIGAVILLGLAESFKAEWLFYNYTKMLVPFAMIAFGVVLTARAKGADFSAFALISFGAYIAARVTLDTGSLAAGIIVLFVVCGVVGALNGALAVYTRLPTIVSTLIVTFVVVIIDTVISFGPSLVVDSVFPTAESVGVAAIIVIVVALAITAALVIFTRLREPMHSRLPQMDKHIIYLFAYIVSALYGGVAALWILTTIGSSYTDSALGVGPNIMLVIVAVLSSRAMDNKWAAVPWALFISASFVLMRFALNIHWVHETWQSLFFYVPLIILFVVAVFANREALRRMGRFG